MKNNLANKVVDAMFDNDLFSQWLGIERSVVEEGRCVLKMKIRKEMLNGFQILHGGIYYSLADSALAFAANSYGIKSVSIETSISHLLPCKEGDEIVATTNEISLSNKIGIYNININNVEGNLVAVFKGTVYRTSKRWFEENK
jgi:acyl-CoA thioesterase